MPLIKEGFAEELEPGIRKHFWLGASRRSSLIPTLFNVQNSTKSSEYVRGIGAMGIDAWDHFQNNNVVPEADFSAGYKTTFTNITYSINLRIQMELVEDNLYSEALQPAEQLGTSARTKQEIDGASVFNNAFTSTFAGADGVELCDAAHPNGPTNSSTQSNYGTYALTKDNVGIVRRAMMEFTDDVGNLMGITPNRLILPPELEDTGIEIVKSMLDPTSGNNAVNPQSGRFDIVVDHYLTDANAWFMVDTIQEMQSLWWFNRVPLDIKLNRIVDDAWILYLARMRYVFGWSDWRWIFGNNPS